MTVDLPLCPEDVNEVLQEIIAKEKFQNPKVVFSEGSKIGEGFLGIDTAVEITEGNRKLELFVKTAPKHVKLRAFMKIRSAFCNELHFYQNIYPELDKFYQEKTGEPLNIATKYYGGSDEDMKEIIVMKNIKVEGFSATDLKKPFDKEHVLVLMKTYAKLHDTTFAFKDQKKEIFYDITKDNWDFFYDLLKSNAPASIMQGRYDKLKKIFGDSMSDRKILEKFKYFADNTVQFISNMKECDTTYSTITHGDCNGNNLMFKNKDGNLELCLIDFQGTRVASPMMDLSFAFYASCTSEENLSQLDYYLDEYYKVLSMTIKKLGSNPDTLYPKSLIREHWKKSCEFALIIGIHIIETSLFKDGEVMNIVDSIDNPPTKEEQLRRAESCDNEEFARRMRVLFQHLIDNDFM